MRRQDWLAACVTAVAVAVLTVGLMAPPVAWADEQPRVEIPALPSTNLTIPAINATVTATAATPAPGEAVKVTLTVKASPDASVAEVPVTVTVTKTEANLLSRMPPFPQTVTQASSNVPVGSNGDGTAVVELPLTWATPMAETAQKDRAITLQEISYRMVLSSTLGGQAAPAELNTVSRLMISQRNMRQDAR